MGITARFITPQNLKGQKSMSSTSKTQALGKNSFNEYYHMLYECSIADLELLLDWYALYEDHLFEDQIEAIKNCLHLRRSSLGRELE